MWTKYGSAQFRDSVRQIITPGVVVVQRRLWLCDGAWLLWPSATGCRARFRRGEQGDCIGDALGGLAAPIGVEQLRLILGIGKIAELDQDRRHVGRLEHPEAGGTLRIVDEADIGRQLADERVG